MIKKTRTPLWMRKAGKGLMAAAFSLMAAGTIFPILWIFNNSFKPSADIVIGKSFELSWPPVFTGYVRALFESEILRYFLNSLIITTSTIVLSILCSTMLSYAITRMKWKLQKPVYNLILLGILLPSQIVLVPIFVIMQKLGLIDNPLALILTMSAFSISMSTLMACSFFRGIPREMEEAAVIDGCGIFRLFFNIMIPIIKPCLATMSLNIFINSWNEFIFSLILISNEKYKTLPIGLMTFVGRYQTDWTSIFASLVIASVIPIIIFVLFSNEIENALTAGAVLK